MTVLDYSIVPIVFFVVIVITQYKLETILNIEMLPLCSLIHIIFGLFIDYQLNQEAFYYGLTRCNPEEQNCD